jgi:hypothetical protein
VVLFVLIWKELTLWLVACVFFSEWVKFLYTSGDDIPSFETLSNYRGARDIDILEVWCTYFFPAVVVTWHFKGKAPLLCLSKFITVSDEAFAVTVVENFYERWKMEGEMFAKGQDIDGKLLPRAKWTDAMGALGKRNKGGWSKEGIVQFNCHSTDVNAHRNLEGSVLLEREYLKKAKEEEGISKNRNEDGFKRKSEEIVAFDDFSPVAAAAPKNKKAPPRASLLDQFEEDDEPLDDDEEEEDESDDASSGSDQF